jgi:spermidine/putrescine-binding protein
MGDEVEIIAVPNANDTGSCPWFALRVIVIGYNCDDDDDDGDDIDDDDARIEQLRQETHEFLAKANEKRAEPQRKWAEEAYMFLDVNGPATTSQIARAVGYSTANIRTYLCKMHDRGEIVRADIRTSSAQSKASATVWALELSDFLPEERDI